MLAIVSCDPGNNGGSSEGPDPGSDGQGDDDTYPEGTEGLIYNKNSKVSILVGDGVSQAKAMDIYNILARLLDDPENITLTTSSDPEATHEIVLGNSSRDITEKAYQKLDRVRDPMNSELGYVIYSNGSSLAVVWDEDDVNHVRDIALDALTQKALTASHLVCPAGSLDSKKVDLQNYWAQKDKEYLADQWEALEQFLGEGSDEIIKELKDLDSMITERGDLIAWFASLIDTDICVCSQIYPVEYAAAGNTCTGSKYCGGAGYYYSNSARNTNGYLPDLESTDQAVGFWSSSGMKYYVNKYNRENAERVSAIPDWLVKKMGTFAYAMQEDDGYFYHPQWNRQYIIENSRSSRRSRDLEHGIGLVQSANMTLKYTTPTGVKGENEIKPSSKNLTSPIATGAVAAAAKVLAVADSVGIDDRLKDKASFETYLASLDIKNDSYTVGNTLTAMTDEILERDKKLAEEGKNYKLIDICLDWLTENQNPETGHWDWPDSKKYNDDYHGVNGILKISGVYEAGGRVYPNAEAACRSIMKAISSTQQISAVVDVYNTWFALSNVLKLVEAHGGAGGTTLAERIYAEIRTLAPAGIKASRQKILPLQMDDGSFAYSLSASGIAYSSPTSQGCPAAVPNTTEGDVNGTNIGATGIRGFIYLCLGIPIEMRPILFGEADRQRYISLIQELNAIKKDDEFVDIVYADFDDETVGQTAVGVGTTLLSKTGSANVIKDPRGKGNVVEFVSKKGNGDHLYITDPSSAPSLQTFCFEGEFCVTSVGSSEYALQIFMNEAAMITFNFSDPQPLVNEDGDYIDKEGNVLADGASPITQFTKLHIWNRSSDKLAYSFNIELGADISINQWFGLKVEYYVGNHDTVRIKIYLDEDLEDKSEEMKLIAVTDNYYDQYGVKLSTGRGNPSSNFTSTRLYVMQDAELTLLMDNLSSYRTKKAYTPEDDVNDQPSYNIDPPSREELIYDFDDSDDITSGGAYTVSNADAVSVIGGALNIDYSSGKAPSLLFPAVIRQKGTDCATIQMDIKWDSASNGKDVLCITATDRFALNRRVLKYYLTVSGDHLILNEVDNSGKKHPFNGISIPKASEEGGYTNFKIDFYHSKDLALFYIDGKFAGASALALGSGGDKSEIFDVTLSLVESNAVDLTLDNIKIEKNANSFDAAVAPDKDPAKETFDKADPAILGGGAALADGNIDSASSGKHLTLAQNGAWLKLPVFVMSDLTNAYTLSLDMLENAGRGELYEINFKNSKGNIVWALRMVATETEVSFYEAAEKGIISMAPLASYPLGEAFNLTIELYPAEKKLLVLDGVKCIAIGSTYYNKSTLKADPVVTALEIISVSSQGDLKLDNVMFNAIYKYYLAPTVTPITNAESKSETLTFEYSSTGNLPSRVTSSLSSYAADLRVEQMLNDITGKTTNVLAFQTSAGSNDSLKFTTTKKANATGVAFEADLYLENGTTTQFFMRGGNGTAYMFTLDVSGSTIRIKDSSDNDGGLGAKHNQTLYESLSTNKWFKLKVEYYYGKKNTVRMVFSVNGTPVAISDNYYGVGADKNSMEPRENIGNIEFYTLGASSGTVYIDNVSYTDITNTFAEKADFFNKTAKSFINAQEWKKSTIKAFVKNPDGEAMDGYNVQFTVDHEVFAKAATKKVYKDGVLVGIYAEARIYIDKDKEYGAMIDGLESTYVKVDASGEAVIMYS